MLRDKFRDDADAVDIGGDGRGHDERFFAARERDGAARSGRLISSHPAKKWVTGLM